MKYVFQPTPKSYVATYCQWFENTDSTPNSLHDAGFMVCDLRSWFMKWVFK